MDAFREWLRTQGIDEAHLDAYVRGAQRVVEAARGASPMPKHLDLALTEAERGGATAQQLANLKRIGDAYLRFLREAQPSAPAAVSSFADLPVPEPIDAPRPAAERGPGRCGFCGAAIEVGHGAVSVGKLGGVGTAAGAVVGWLFGCIGGLALWAAFGAVALLVGAIGTHLRCSSCGAAPDSHEVTSALRAKLLTRRALLGGGSVALAAAAVALALIWLSLAAARFSR